MITPNEPSEATAKLGDITTHNALAGAAGWAWQYGCFRRGLLWGFPSLQTVARWDDVPPNVIRLSAHSLGVIHTRAFSPRHVLQTAFQLVFLCSYVYKL